jgi:hypothetical protein
MLHFSIIFNLFSVFQAPAVTSAELFLQSCPSGQKLLSCGLDNSQKNTAGKPVVTLNLSCHLPFTYAENGSVLRTTGSIDKQFRPIQGSFLQTKVKMQCIELHFQKENSY